MHPGVESRTWDNVKYYVRRCDRSLVTRLQVTVMLLRCRRQGNVSPEHGGTELALWTVHLCNKNMGNLHENACIRSALAPPRTRSFDAYVHTERISKIGRKPRELICRKTNKQNKCDIDAIYRRISNVLHN